MCLLDYDYMKNHYRLIAVDLSRHKELDTDPKSVQPIKVIGQLKNLHANNNEKTMFALTIFEEK